MRRLLTLQIVVLVIVGLLVLLSAWPTENPVAAMTGMFMLGRAIWLSGFYSAWLSTHGQSKAKAAQ